LAILTATNVWKTYIDEQVVLKNVQLILNEGDFVSIQGRSGAGKSTLLRIVGLLEKMDRGELHLFGQATNDLSEKKRAKLRLEKIGFVFQSLNLIPHITATENIEVPLWLKKVNATKRKERALDLLSKFGLKSLADRFPRCCFALWIILVQICFSVFRSYFASLGCRNTLKITLFPL
jgi:putative ABC transport system ATP-binding protein